MGEAMENENKLTISLKRAKNQILFLLSMSKISDEDLETVEMIFDRIIIEHNGE